MTESKVVPKIIRTEHLSLSLSATNTTSFPQPGMQRAVPAIPMIRSRCRCRELAIERKPSVTLPVDMARFVRCSNTSNPAGEPLDLLTPNLCAQQLKAKSSNLIRRFVREEARLELGHDQVVVQCRRANVLERWGKTL